MAEVRAWLSSAGAFLAALVASSHHSLHMALISIGLGGGALFVSPLARRLMILASLVMVSLAAAWGLRHGGAAKRAGVAASVILSLGLVVWSVATHGW